MKNQSGTIKTNLELDRVVMGVQVVTGDSLEEVMIFRDKQTHTHCIIIYISSSPKTVKFQKSVNSQCYLGSYRVQEGSEHEILKVESQPTEVDPCFKTILAKECLEYGSSS